MVDAILARRERARKAGDFVSADRLREVLRTTFGVEVLDDVRAWRAVGRVLRLCRALAPRARSRFSRPLCALSETHSTLQ